MRDGKLAMKPTEPIFTDFRRTLIAKTLFDLLKIAVAGMLASKFFAEFPLSLRVSLVMATFVLLIMGILICPRNGRKE